MDPAANPNRSSRALALGIVVLTLLTFARVTTCEFVRWDDRFTLHHNPRMNPPAWAHIGAYWREWKSGEYGLYIPVIYTVWSGLAAIARVEPPDLAGISLNPWVFHTANLLLHVVSGLLVFQILTRLIGRGVPAMVGAMLFAVHPVQVEPVAWASGLKDVLSGMLVLATILQYVIWAQRGASSRAVYLCAVVTAALAMLAKPSAMMVGPICFVLDGLLIRRQWKAAFVGVLPMLLIALPIAVITRQVQIIKEIPPVQLWQRPLVAADAITFYLRKLVMPLSLGIDYGRRPSVVLAQPILLLLGKLVALLMLAIGLWRWRRDTPAAAGLLFLLPVVPVLGLTPFQFQHYSTVADHYLYVAMLGPALVLAWMLNRSQRPMSRIIAAIVILVLAGRSFAQSAHWRDDFTLMSHALRVNPASFAASNNLGAAYRARVVFESAYAAAAEDRGDFTTAQRHHANASHALERAARCFEESLRLAPPGTSFEEMARTNLAEAMRALNPSLPQ